MLLQVLDLVRKNKIYIYAVTALLALTILIVWFSVSGHKVFSNDKSESFSAQLLSPVDLSRGESKSEEVIEYQAEAHRGDSPARLFKIILTKYDKDNNIGLSNVEINSLSDRIAREIPMNLKIGDKITLRKSEIENFMAK